jgi:hypothetical protein
VGATTSGYHVGSVISRVVRRLLVIVGALVALTTVGGLPRVCGGVDLARSSSDRMAGVWPLVLASLLVAGCGRYGFEHRVGGDSGTDDANRDAPSDILGVCGPGYASWAPLTSRYRIAAALDWSVAEADCETDGGHLVVVNDLAEHTEVRARIATGNIWIGMTDRITESQYLQVTGGLPDYTAWSGAPPSNTGEDCVEILTNSNYEDTSCIQVASAFGYVCECDGTSSMIGAF